MTERKRLIGAVAFAIVVTAYVMPSASVHGLSDFVAWICIFTTANLLAFWFLRPEETP